MVPTSTSSETPGGGGAARPMGKTPISPLAWGSALSRESKEVTKPTSRSDLLELHLAFVCHMAAVTWQLSHGNCLPDGSCDMALVYHMAIVRHMAVVCHVAIFCPMVFVCRACTYLLSTMCISKRHIALAVFDQARAYLCNSACSKASGICRCKCAWPMYTVQAV